jgi:Tol biopolymer transport system component
MTIAAGTRLGRYEIRSPIGEGGMGEVYLAEDTTLERKVALKILPGTLAQDGERMQRFVREAKAASALNHPNIAHVSKTVDRMTGGGAEAVSSTAEAGARSTSSAEYLVGEVKKHKTGATVVVALLALVLAGVGYAIYKWTAKQSKPALSFQSAKFTRLTSTGKASDAAISPDGKYVAHVKSEAGQQSLWLRQVATTSDTQIVPPSQQFYYGITFSKDGNYIYYALGETNNTARTLYQVPVLGGASRKLIENVTSPVSLSPDGTRLALSRTARIRSS